MARTTISQRIALIGGDAIEAQLKALGAVGEKAFDAIQAAAERLKGPGAEFARNMDAAQKRVREFGESVTAVGERMRNWGAGLSLAVTAPLGLMGRSFIDAASDAQEADSAFGHLFDDNAGRVREWSATVASELGRGTQAIRDQAMSFQQLFSQVEPNRDVAVGLSQDFTMLAQDLSSFFNVTESDALAKLRSGLSGESEPLRAFGVFLNEAAVQAKGLELGLGGVTGEMTDQEKVLARAAVIMEQTTAAQGDAARTSGSYANQLRRLQGVWADLSVTLGEIILPVALQVVQALASVVSTIQSLPGPVQATIVVVAALAAALGPILLLLGSMTMGIGMAATGFATFMGAAASLTPVLGGLSASFGLVATAMRAVMALMVPMLAWPVVLAAAVGFMAVALYQHWDAIVAAVAGAFLRIQEVAQGTIDWLSETWEGLWTSTQEIFEGFVEGILGFFGGMAEGIRAAFEAVRAYIASWIDWAAAKIEALSSALGSLIGRGNAPEYEGPPALAGGGRVRGPGSGTSDSILARLSNGEFVIRAQAVQHYGPQIFDALNRMMMPRGGIPGFAAGGLVAGPGGLSSEAQTILNLTIGGETFQGLLAPRETAERLVRHATSQQIKSAGRKPGWFAG